MDMDREDFEDGFSAWELDQASGEVDSSPGYEQVQEFVECYATYFGRMRADRRDSGSRKLSS